MMKRILKNIRYKLAKFFYKNLPPTNLYFYKNFQKDKNNHTSIGSTTYIGNKKKFKVNDRVFIGHFNFIEASHGIEIGEGVQITNYVSITTHSSHNSIRLYGKEYSNFNNLKGYLIGGIKIGDYTFIGPHCVIMPNTTIGKGCIVKAFSYLSGNFPDFSIIGGNLGKVIGNTKDKDKELLKQFPELETFYKEWAE